MDTITVNSAEELVEKLAAMGINATNPPTAHEFTVTGNGGFGNSVQVIRNDVSENWTLDIGLGDVSFMVEGVGSEGIGDVAEYLDGYIETMRDNDEPISEFTWEQIRESAEYASALEWLTNWKSNS